MQSNESFVKSVVLKSMFLNDYPWCIGYHQMTSLPSSVNIDIDIGESERSPSGGRHCPWWTAALRNFVGCGYAYTL